MSKPQPHEPCWCGSDVPYENCHRLIDSFPTDQRLFGARQLYAGKWRESAANLEDQGAYDWMAGLLDQFAPRNIFDIGCGTGNGIVALLKRFPKTRIVSVDENTEVIKIAKERIESFGARVNVVRRLRDKATGERSHALSVERGKLRITPGVNLIECDILEDPEIDAFLKSQRKFDAITVWLIGSHLLRYHEGDSLRDTISSPNDYRLHVQAVAFGLATFLLRRGGVLHIVDRGPTPRTPEMQENLLAMPRRLVADAGGFLQAPQLKYRAYGESVAENAVRMVDNSGNMVPTGNLALVSVTAVKV